MSKFEKADCLVMWANPQNQEFSTAKIYKKREVQFFGSHVTKANLDFEAPEKCDAEKRQKRREKQRRRCNWNQSRETITKIDFSELDF